MISPQVPKNKLNESGILMKGKFRKERQAIQDFEKRLEQGESSKKMGTLTRWISLKRKTDKNNQVVETEKIR